MALAGCSITEPVGAEATLEPVLAFAEDEGLFAYARISPDGQFVVYSAQAREHSGPPDRTQLLTVVDLRDGSVLFQELGIDATRMSCDASAFVISPPQVLVTNRPREIRTAPHDAKHGSTGRLHFFDMSSGFWLNLQARWDLYHAERSEAAVLRKIPRYRAKRRSPTHG